METKICSNCKEVKDLTEFWKKGKKHQQNCILCQKSINKARYESDKTRHIDHIRGRVARRNREFYDWKSTLSCMCCGESYYKCLDFHHVDPATKVFTISDAVRLAGNERTIEEIGKCVVVCKNCHAKIHGGIIECPSGDIDVGMLLLD